MKTITFKKRAPLTSLLRVNHFTLFNLENGIYAKNAPIGDLRVSEIEYLAQ